MIDQTTPTKTTENNENNHNNDFKPMECSKYYCRAVTHYPVIVQPKINGIRMIATKSGGQWQFSSRSGEKLYPPLTIVRGLNEIIAPEGVVIDGELSDIDYGQTIDPATIANLVRQPNSADSSDITFAYYLFDMIRPKDSYTRLAKRLVTLDLIAAVSTLNHNIPCIRILSRQLANNPSEINAIYESTLADDYEGVVIKYPDSIYTTDQKNLWLKLKPHDTLDLQSVNIDHDANGFIKNFNCTINGQTQKIPVASARRAAVTKEYDENPHALVEVSFERVTNTGTLKYPAFIRLRTDKTTPDLSAS